jgi:predicted aspartyl protease
MLEFNALWDTGATASVITEGVATRLSLRPEGTTKLFHAQGSSFVPVYFVNLGLPNRVRFVGIRVSQGVLPGCDVLIGMDIINKGDFAVTNRDGASVFSFQMPSMNLIDFEEIVND